MSRLVRRFLKGGKAQSMIETAVLAPLLLLIVLGIIDLGRVFYAYVTITNASREGARTGSMYPANYGLIQTRVIEEAGGTLDLGPGNSRIQTQIDYQGGDYISVFVSYRFQTFFIGPVLQFVSGALGGPTLPVDFWISNTATMPVMLGNPPPPPPPPPTNTPTWAYITLTPSSGYVGMTVTIGGGNWGSNKTVTITWDGGSPFSLWSNSSGNITGTFVVPAGASLGSHTVGAAVSGGPSANAPFNVVPVPTATPTGTATKTATATPCAPIVFNLLVGGNTWVSGTGPANQTVQISIQGQGDTYSGTISPSGVFSVTTSVLVQGQIVVGQVNSCSPSSATVIGPTPTRTPTPNHPYIILGPPSGLPGDRVLVEGHNFGSNQNVTIKWGFNNVSTSPNNPRTDTTGNFSASFTVPPGSAIGIHSVTATTSLGSATAIFQILALSTPTITSTPTVTPTPTKTPTYAYFTAPPCVPTKGMTSLTLQGYNWPSGGQITVYFDGSIKDTLSAASDGRWASTIGANVADGVHLLTAIEMKSGIRFDFPFTEPCPATATPMATTTPFPDLVIANISANPVSVPQNQPDTVSVTVRNQGTTDANSIFWVDLYVDPASPPAVNDPGDFWQAISSIGAGQQIQLSFAIPGFASIGTHSLVAQVDTTNRIVEGDEGNNLSATLNVDVVQGVPTATPTATATPTLTAVPGNSLTATAQAWTPTPLPKDGSISGSTWIFSGGGWTVPQGRVTVYVYKGSTLIASANSTADGRYKVTGVPAGSGYTVVGEAMVNGLLYSDTRSGVTVTSGSDTSNINLFLMP